MLFKFNSFRSRQSTNEPAENLSYEESNLLESQPETNPSANSTLTKLFKKNTLYAGPDVMYENEAWAPVQSTGLFHRRRAILEEQSSSTTEAQ